MKLTTAVAAGISAAVLVSLAVTGCSGGGGGNSNTPPPNQGNGSGNSQPAAKIYSNDDLVKILTDTNTSLSAGGTVTNLGAVTPDGKPAKSVYQTIIDEGGSITPSSCGQLFDKINSDASSLGGVTSAYAAKLQWGGSFLSATSSATPIDVSTLGTLLTGDLTALTSDCGAATVSAGPLNAKFAVASETASTNADTTLAYSETLSSASVNLHSVAVVGIDGNILFLYEGLTPSLTVQDGVTAINAAVAAAD